MPTTMVPPIASAPPEPTVQDALLLHQAAALLNLHTQAVAVQNIRSLVPLILDLQANNFNCWHEYFLLTSGKYSPEDHVLSDAMALTSPDWEHMDYAVGSWILRTISVDLADTMMEHGATADSTWLAVESQFLGNRETRTSTSSFAASPKGSSPSPSTAAGLRPWPTL